ncbi:uncharacterized protein LOC135947637 [Cloeon dipterum]|uniref:uncharacterized protein LOC135947637 n=1 Tax=Cloeon dipterum TaxID=197152 RepID=UPI003220948E
MGCIKCRIIFESEYCFDAHLKNRICDARQVCKICGFLIDHKLLARKAHECYTKYCRRCKLYVENTHLCFIKKNNKPRNLKVRDERTLLTFADFETSAEEHKLEATGWKVYHRVNVACSQTTCHRCRDTEFEPGSAPCHMCGLREIIISDFGAPTRVNVIKNFIQKMHEKSRNARDEQGKKIGMMDHYIMFHNLGLFDGCFVLNEIFRTCEWQVLSVILSGRRILKLQIENAYTKARMTFLDFLQFVPFPLEKMPKAFRLEKSCKGFFPHCMNKIENYGYDSVEMPDVELFAPDNMNNERRGLFLPWHADEQRRLREKNEKYNFQTEILKYCSLDVTILRMAALKFRKFFTDFDCEPFIETMTLPALVSIIYRRNFYADSSIGLLPISDSYRSMQSKEAYKFIRYLETVLKITDLEHSGNGREKVIAGAPVDVYHPASKRIYQFHGCYWHGCKKCFTERANYGVGRHYETIAGRRIATEARTRHLRQLGFTVIAMKECQWKRMMARSPLVYRMLSKDPLVVRGQLRARDCLFGGRTNCVKFHCVPAPDEEILYLDVCSLYPSVQKYCRYVMGHPTVITDNFPPFEDLCGFVHCKVVAPQALYHPVLPQKINGKLLFHLCSRCATEKSQTFCTHNEEERAFCGSWTTFELQLALKFRYKIVQMFEVWHYDQTTRLGEDGQGLFVSFVDTFLQRKQEASGWPSEQMTEEDKTEFLESYRLNENVTLDPNNIGRNEVVRTVAKLCLNSLWGKFGQRVQQKTSIVGTRNEILRLLSAPNVTVNSILPAGSKMLVNYEDDDNVQSNVNCLIAALVTSHARIVLYQMLHILGERVLYYDTDAAIFLQKKGEKLLKTGPFLGCLTNEMESYGEEAKIEKFVALGPKDYCIRVGLGDGTTREVRKLKGITLRHNNRAETSMDAMEHSEKVLKLNYDKRARVSQYDTVPWGTKQGALELQPDPSIEIEDWTHRNFAA